MVAGTILDFLADYGECLDANELERWPDFFTDVCLYEIQSRENVALGLPAAIIRCESHGALMDRVTALRDALTYEFRYYRHYIANARVLEVGRGTYTVRSNFLVLTSDEAGDTTIFAAGQYHDEIVATPEGFRFRKKIAVTDTFGFNNLVSVPL
jgi:anthranilate 1,2-dioxygenase small subunit